MHKKILIITVLTIFTVACSGSKSDSGSKKILVSRTAGSNSGLNADWIQDTYPRGNERRVAAEIYAKLETNSLDQRGVLGIAPCLALLSLNESPELTREFVQECQNFNRWAAELIARKPGPLPAPGSLEHLLKTAQEIKPKNLQAARELADALMLLAEGHWSDLLELESASALANYLEQKLPVMAENALRRIHFQQTRHDLMPQIKGLDPQLASPNSPKNWGRLEVGNTRLFSLGNNLDFLAASAWSVEGHPEINSDWSSLLPLRNEWLQMLNESAQTTESLLKRSAESEKYLSDLHELLQENARALENWSRIIREILELTGAENAAREFRVWTDRAQLFHRTVVALHGGGSLSLADRQALLQFLRDWQRLNSTTDNEINKFWPLLNSFGRAFESLASRHSTASLAQESRFILEALSVLQLEQREFRSAIESRLVNIESTLQDHGRLTFLAQQAHLLQQLSSEQQECFSAESPLNQPGPLDRIFLRQCLAKAENHALSLAKNPLLTGTLIDPTQSEAWWPSIAEQPLFGLLAKTMGLSHQDLPQPRIWRLAVHDYLSLSLLNQDKKTRFAALPQLQRQAEEFYRFILQAESEIALQAARLHNFNDDRVALWARMQSWISEFSRQYLAGQSLEILEKPIKEKTTEAEVRLGIAFTFLEERLAYATTVEAPYGGPLPPLSAGEIFFYSVRTKKLRELTTAIADFRTHRVPLSVVAETIEGPFRDLYQPGRDYSLIAHFRHINAFEEALRTNHSNFIISTPDYAIFDSWLPDKLRFEIAERHKLLSTEFAAFSQNSLSREPWFASARMLSLQSQILTAELGPSQISPQQSELLMLANGTWLEAPHTFLSSFSGETAHRPPLNTARMSPRRPPVFAVFQQLARQLSQ